MPLLPFALCIAGFLLLAMATSRQQDIIFRRKLDISRQRAARVAGWCVLVLVLVIDVAGQGWGLGLVSYSGHTSVAAGLVYLALIGRARINRRAR